MKANVPLRVLVVDDEAAIRTLIRNVLELEGFEVVEAKNGTTALRLLCAPASPFVVVLDYHLPDLTGLELIERQTTDCPDHPHAYILVTARVQTLARKQPPLVEHLKIPILFKPFDIEALLTLVKQAMQ